MCSLALPLRGGTSTTAEREDSETEQPTSTSKFGPVPFLLAHSASKRSSDRSNSQGSPGYSSIGGVRIGPGFWQLADPLLVMTHSSEGQPASSQPASSQPVDVAARRVRPHWPPSAALRRWPLLDRPSYAAFRSSSRRNEDRLSRPDGRTETRSP
jgi:hypothetical protein